jgi:hypothetical protein
MFASLAPCRPLGQLSLPAAAFDLTVLIRQLQRVWEFQIGEHLPPFAGGDFVG